MKVNRGYKIQDDKQRFYSKKPLLLLRAKAQQRALYASYKGAGFICSTGCDGEPVFFLEGAGLFSDVLRKAKEVASNAATYGLDKIAAFTDKKLRLGYSPKVREVLKNYGDWNVTGIVVRREPIHKYINMALNVITMGLWSKATKEMAFDKLYHLSMVVSLSKGDRTINLLIEKNEVINMTTNFSTSDKLSFITVPLGDASLTLNEMLNKTEELYGRDGFFKYDAFTDNCQKFINTILNANGLNTSNISSFIMADVMSLLQKLPSYTKPFAKITTNIAGLANKLLLGKGEIVMSSSAYFAEHQKLISLLRGVSSKLLKEASEQEKEAAGHKGKTKGRGWVKVATLDSPCCSDCAEHLPCSGGRAGRVGDSKFKASKTISGDVMKNVECPPDRRYDPSKEYGPNDNVCIKTANGLQYVRIGDIGKSPCVLRTDSGKSRNMGLMTPEDCAAAKEKLFRDTMKRKDPTGEAFRPIVEGLTKTGDFLVNNVASAVGVPSIVTDLYKEYAPPGSEYYKGKGAGYLHLAKKAAKKSGYSNWKTLDFADKPKYKLMIIDDAGKRIYFGSKGMNDFLLYKLQGDKKAALKKREAYLKRSAGIKGDWKDNKYSPNNLSRNILWNAMEI